jgi:hypothetical protein
MKTHYRRISKTALSAFRTSLGPEGGSKPDEYAALASVSGVKVGTEASGYVVFQVVGEDSESLPGKLCAETFGGLKNAAREAVHCCRIREAVEDEEGNPVVRIRTVAESALPEGLSRFPDWAEGEPTPLIPEEGDTILAVGLNPHRFI